jgi:hypothetical protein
MYYGSLIKVPLSDLKTHLFVQVLLSLSTTGDLRAAFILVICVYLARVKDLKANFTCDFVREYPIILNHLVDCMVLYRWPCFYIVSAEFSGVYT